MENYVTKAMQLIEDSTNGLSEHELATPSNSRWSPAQVLEHLAKAFGGSAKAFELQLASGTLAPLRPLTFKDRVGIFLICDLGYFPEGRNAPPMTIPSDAPEGLVAVKRIKENLERVGRALDETEKKWGSRVCIFTHPILGPLTVPQWRKFHFVHTRHHMKQVRERAAQNRQTQSATTNAH
jgi:hypothetical protein